MYTYTLTKDKEVTSSRTFYSIIALAKEDQSDIAAVAKRQKWMKNGNKWDDTYKVETTPPKYKVHGSRFGKS